MDIVWVRCDPPLSDKPTYRLMATANDPACDDMFTADPECFRIAGMEDWGHSSASEGSNLALPSRYIKMFTYRPPGNASYPRF